MRDRRQQNLRRRPRRGELLDERNDPLRQQVVAQVHHERLTADEILGDQHRMRQAARRILRDVGDVDAPRGAVAHRGFDLRLRVADNNPQLAHARSSECLDAVEEHRLVRHRDKLLGAGERERPQARALAAAEDESLHRGG